MKGPKTPLAGPLLLALTVLVAAFVVAPAAHADDADPAAAQASDGPTLDNADRRRVPMRDRRDVPNYDGRADAPTPPGRKLLWVPRVLFAPVYAVHEFVIRRPLAAMVTAAERGNVASKLGYIFTFGTGGKVGLLPTALFDFGLRPSVGLYFFANDSPTDADAFRFHFGWGGADWWRVSVRQRFRFAHGVDAPNTEFQASGTDLHFLFSQRPDRIFAGVGLQDDGAERLAYRHTELGGSIGGELVFGDLDAAYAEFEASRNRFDNGDGGMEKADDDLFDALAPDGTRAQGRAAARAQLPGFDGYELVSARVGLNLDSRPSDMTERGSGAQADVWAGLGADVGGDARWITYGGLFGLYWDVNGLRHVLSLRQRLELSHALGDTPTPFAELPTLGGNVGLRGFVDGRFRGSSTTVTTLQWTYPIWIAIDGFIFADVGNSYSESFSGFDMGSLVSSFGMGVRSNADRDAAFSLLVGAGTTRFDADTFGVDDVRVLVGAQHGF